MIGEVANDNIDEQRVRDLLRLVKDPEIPTISVVELGMIRDVTIDHCGCTVTITPTFSGCPAKEVIIASIREHLRNNGIERVFVKTRLTPPWTVADIAPDCYPKLIAANIAPPAKTLAEIRCPRCQSEKVTAMSFFGSTPCKSQFTCRDCLEPFEYFKGIGRLG